MWRVSDPTQSRTSHLIITRVNTSHHQQGVPTPMAGRCRGATRKVGEVDVGKRECAHICGVLGCCGRHDVCVGVGVCQVCVVVKGCCCES